MNIQTERILNLVEEMLDTTRVEAGELQYHPDWFDLKASIREVVAAVQALHQTHRIDILMPPEPLQIYADETRVGQVIINLLNNAIKYSPGRDNVQLTLKHYENELYISVADNGIGIPEDKLKRVFDRFYRVDTLPKGRFAGLGLGLFIASQIVYHHNGKIYVESKEGQGSTFTVKLPRGISGLNMAV